MTRVTGQNMRCKYRRNFAKKYPTEITMLPPTAFFYPLWSRPTSSGSSALTDQFRRAPTPITCGESKAWDKYLDHLTPGRVRREDTNFHRWARPYVADLPDNLGAAPLKIKLRKAAGRVKRSIVG